MIGRVGYTRPATLIEWVEDLFLSGMTREIVGNGTESIPFNVTLFGNGVHNVTPEVWLRVLVAGTLAYGLESWTESNADYAYLSWHDSGKTLIANASSLSGEDGVAGEWYVSRGDLIRLRYSKNASVSSTLDKVATSLWVA